MLLLAAGLCCKVADQIAEGDRLAAEHRWTEAVEAYKRALAEYPHSYDAAWGIARIYCLETRLPDRCLSWTGPLLEAYPGDARYRAARAAGLRERAADHREAGRIAEATADEAEAERLAR